MSVWNTRGTQGAPGERSERPHRQQVETVGDRRVAARASLGSRSGRSSRDGHGQGNGRGHRQDGSGCCRGSRDGHSQDGTDWPVGHSPCAAGPVSAASWTAVLVAAASACPVRPGCASSYGRGACQRSEPPGSIPPSRPGTLRPCPRSGMGPRPVSPARP